MPQTQTQTTQAVTAAVNYLENIGTKPGSTRATVGMNELGNSAGAVADHLSQAAAQARQAVTADVEFTTAARSSDTTKTPTTTWPVFASPHSSATGFE